MKFFLVRFVSVVVVLITGLLMVCGADFTVVNVGMSAFSINGTNNATITLQRGSTYTFSVSSPGHPFDIKTNSSTGTGNRYNIGVTGQGATGGTLTFVVPLDAPTPLNYNCEVHLAMHGIINLIDVANALPTVTITNPAANSKYHAPTNLVIRASASDPDGTVTNIQFFAGVTALGNVTNASPAGTFSFTNANLIGGNYNFFAVARDNLGGATTSAMVNVFLLTNAVAGVPLRLPNGQFVMTLSGIGGQSYTIEGSTNLSTWAPLFSNTAPANLFSITDFTSTNVLQRFYRTRQDF